MYLLRAETRRVGEQGIGVDSTFSWGGFNCFFLPTQWTVRRVVNPCGLRLVVLIYSLGVHLAVSVLPQLLGTSRSERGGRR